MRGAGLNFNAVLYACCRDPAMCEKALRVWDDMVEQGVPPELEPMSKLMLSCLARGRFDDSFRIFLAAIDANLQPGAQVLAALPHAVDRRSVLVEGPLPAEVHRLHVAE